MMYLELKKAIIDWLIEHKNTWQRTNECREHFRQYIFGPDHNYIIGGKVVCDFISAADKLLFAQEPSI